MQPLFSCAFAILLVVFLGRDASAQNGGYVVRGAAKVINGNTIRVSGVDVTLSGVETVEKYDGAAARSLKKRIGNKQVGCMVDGNWSGKNWGYCTSTHPRRTQPSMPPTRMTPRPERPRLTHPISFLCHFQAEILASRAPGT